MGLMLKTQRDGKLRADWYGLYTDQAGKRRVVNLNVRWAGNPPESGSLMDEGDKAFERSRDRAEALAGTRAETPGATRAGTGAGAGAGAKGLRAEVVSVGEKP